MLTTVHAILQDGLGIGIRIPECHTLEKRIRANDWNDKMRAVFVPICQAREAYTAALDKFNAENPPAPAPATPPVHVDAAPSASTQAAAMETDCAPAPAVDSAMIAGLQEQAALPVEGSVTTPDQQFAASNQGEAQAHSPPPRSSSPQPVLRAASAPRPQSFLPLYDQRPALGEAHKLFRDAEVGFIVNSCVAATQHAPGCV